VGISVAPLGEILTDGEELLRGLNPKHCENGMPTEGCFILKAQDVEGPSFGILLPGPGAEQLAPIGTRQGISPDVFLTKLPSTNYGIAQVNVGRALQEVRARGVAFAQNDEEEWGEHSGAHAMLIGYQGLERRTLNELKRFLAKLASERVLKKADQ
jgi:hypothetical protein